MIEGRTLWELVEARAALTPGDRLAVDEIGREMTFRAYRDRAERVAAALFKLGITSGDVVTWQLPTWLESMVLVAALARLDAVQNPILHIYREREVGFCVRQAGTKLLIVPTEFSGVDFASMAQGIAAQVDDLKVLLCDRDLPEADPDVLPAYFRNEREVRWLFYTSGTTADPKGAKHTDATLCAVGRGMNERFAVTPKDRYAVVFPFPHIAGVSWVFSALLSGCQLILVESFIPDLVVDVLNREGVTLAGAGTIFHRLYLERNANAEQPIFGDVRGFPNGGAPKPPDLHFAMREAFPQSAGILSGYGLTEAPVLTMSAPTDCDEDLAFTEGAPMPDVVLKLVKEDGSIAAPGEEGEVRAKAPQLMLGYLDDSLDVEAFDDDGYFRTGDLGRLNDRNMLIISGRLKDVIIRKGENISAKEVEDHLYGHSKVADVAVVGLPDPVSGERACAVVTVVDPDDPLEFGEMVDFLVSSGLMRQKIPEQLELIDVIPRNPAGKILKRELQERYRDSTPNHRN